MRRSMQIPWSPQASPPASFPAYLLLILLLALAGACDAPADGQMDEGAASEDEAAPKREADREPGLPGGQNHLAGETSPYLLQHVTNPVDWHPWGKEALEKARREKKVIFLSIGYSSCHWCHVMERESFSDKEIADYINEHFVCIKVDREERPDIDTIYMTSLHIFNQLSGSGRGGGWPLSMFLTPEALPFFGGTYFPARDGDRGASMGFLTLLKRVHQVWEEQPERIDQDAQMITKALKEELEGRRPQALEPLGHETLAKLQEVLGDQFDAQYGGFGYSEVNPQQPKFPEPSNLLFLIDRVNSLPDGSEASERAREMLLVTLQKMALGGIRDHLGGGFHRYSVDRFWRIPHFEKMLYDNGQLATVYSETYALEPREDFRRVVQQMLAFVQRELTDEQGGFYSALDADSEHEEGKFYRWTREEVQKLLSEEQYALFAPIYGLESEPNFEGEYYALQLEKPLGETAQDMEMTEQQLNEQLAPLRQKLLEARSKRIRPLTDTKILTSWNGLMIAGFADAGRIFQQPQYVETASRAAQFVLEHLRTEHGRLLRTYSKGEAKLNGYLNDYAFFVHGLLALHQATGDDRWLQAARELTRTQIELFWDETNGGFFFTSEDHESLLARNKELHDGAQPSGNSVSVTNLAYLSRHLDAESAESQEYRAKARQVIRASSGTLQRSPHLAPWLLRGLQFAERSEEGENATRSNEESKKEDG